MKYTEMEARLVLAKKIGKNLGRKNPFLHMNDVILTWTRELDQRLKAREFFLGDMLEFREPVDLPSYKWWVEFVRNFHLGSLKGRTVRDRVSTLLIWQAKSISLDAS